MKVEDVVRYSYGYLFIRLISDALVSFLVFGKVTRCAKKIP